MEQPVKLEALIEEVPHATLAAKLRALMPGIDQRIRDGVSHQDIVDALNRHGGLGTELKLRTFRSYLFRYRKKASTTGVDRGPREAGAAVRVSPGPPVASAQLVRNASDLKRLRNQEVDLDELSRIGRRQGGG